MDLYAYTNVVRCQAFQLMLSDKTKAWYRTLKSNTISSFSEFGKLFLSLLDKRRKQKTMAYMLTLQQGRDEFLKDLFNIFNLKKIKVT